MSEFVTLASMWDADEIVRVWVTASVIDLSDGDEMCEREEYGWIDPANPRVLEGSRNYVSPAFEGRRRDYLGDGLSEDEAFNSMRDDIIGACEEYGCTPVDSGEHVYYAPDGYTDCETGLVWSYAACIDAKFYDKGMLVEKYVTV